MKRRERIELPALDETPIGLAWSELLDRARRDDPALFERIARFLVAAPDGVKSGIVTLEPPVERRAWNAELGIWMHGYEGAEHLYRSELPELLPHKLVMWMAHAVLAKAQPKASIAKDLRAQREAIREKAKSFGTDLAALGVSLSDAVSALLWFVKAPDGRSLRDLLSREAQAEIHSALERCDGDRPGSARVLILEIAAHGARERMRSSRLFDPESPPRTDATASLDAFICVLSLFSTRATLSLAERCALAAHPDEDPDKPMRKAIKERARRYRQRYGEALRMRPIPEWGDGDLSPFASVTDPEPGKD